jgi:hypothetical protein
MLLRRANAPSRNGGGDGGGFLENCLGYSVLEKHIDSGSDLWNRRVSRRVRDHNSGGNARCFGILCTLSTVNFRLAKKVETLSVLCFCFSTATASPCMNDQRSRSLGNCGQTTCGKEKGLYSLYSTIDPKFVEWFGVVLTPHKELCLCS